MVMGMVVDIGIVKNQIKPKSDSTLRNMRKDDLIEYIRCLENNYNVAVSFNNQQARNIESLGITKVVRCKDCKHWHEETGWCNHHSHFVNTEGEACHPWESPEWKMLHADDFCSYGERRADENET